MTLVGKHNLRSVLVDAAVCLLLVFTGCHSEIRGTLTSKNADAVWSRLSGRILGVAVSGPSAALNQDCQSAGGIDLYEVAGSQGESRMTASTVVMNDGTFTFAALSLDPAKVYYLLTTRCDAVLSRVISGPLDQDVTPGSSLLTFALGQVSDLSTLALSSPKMTEVARLIAGIQGNASAAAAFDALRSDPALKSLFLNLMGYDAEALKDAAPLFLSVAVPSVPLSEGDNAAFSAVARHWDPAYKVAYRWTLDDAGVATTAKGTWLTGADSQGKHTLTVHAGQQDAGGNLNTQKPTSSRPSSVTVDNTVAATAPPFALKDSPADALALLRQATVVLTVATGDHLETCASFAAFALTESAEAPADANAYRYHCETAPAQDVAYTLAAGQDGLRTIRLWARDSAGNISTLPRELSVRLKQTPPAFQALPLAGAALDGYINASERSTNAPLAGPVAGTGFDAARYALVAAAASCEAATTYAPTMPVANAAELTTDGSYKICVQLTDDAGNPPAFGASPVLTLKTAIPAFTSLALVNEALNGTINGADHGLAHALVNAVVGSDYDSAGYAVVNSAATCDGSLSYSTSIPHNNSASLSSDGSYKVCVKLSDAAGNTPAYGATTAFTLAAAGPGAFSITSPGAQTNAATPAVTWSAAAGSGVIYSLAVAASSGCATPLQTYSNVSGTSQTLTSLADGPYYLCLSATDSTGNTRAAANDSFAFSVDTVAPGAFNLTSPSSGTHTNNAVVTFTWGAASGAGTLYDLKLAASAGCASPAASYLGLSVTTQTTAALADGTYYVCLKARDSAGNATDAGNTNLTITIDTAAPGSFSVSSPEAFTNSATPTVTWSAATGASSYDLKVASNSTCTSPLQTYSGLTAPSQALTSLSDGAYYLCLTAADLAGNTTTAVSTFVVDTVPPSVTSLSTNSGAASTASNYVAVALSANDDSHNIVKFCLRYNTTAAPSTADSCWTAVNAPAPGVTPAPAISFSGYYFPLGFGTSSYTVYAWVMDAAQNISALTNGGAGSDGVDKATISYNPGQPPTVTNIVVANSDAPSAPPSATDLTIASGGNVYIKWTASDDHALPANPITLYYTTDDSHYTQIATGLANGANGACQVDDAATTVDDLATGCYLWTGGSPTSSYYKIRAAVTDNSSMTSLASSSAVNVPQISFLAGNTELGIGASAKSAVLFNYTASSSNADPASFAVLPSGGIFFRDIYKGLYYIAPETGILQLLIPTTGTSSGDGGPATSATLKSPVKIVADYKNGILIYDYDRIRRVDTTVTPFTIDTVIGGGSSTADGVGPHDVKITSFSTFSPSIGGLLTTFFALPNGNIYFSGENSTANPILNSTTRIRVYNAAAGTVSSIHVSGVGTSRNAATDVGECMGRIFGVTYDITNSTLTSAQQAIYYQPSQPNCYAASIVYGMVNYDPVTFVSTSPHPAASYNFEMYVQGLDGNLYYVTRNGGSLYRYNPATQTKTLLVGTGVTGTCNDGTAALSCAIDLNDAFVSAEGQIYFMDRSRLRTVDRSGNVLTVVGQSFSAGDGGLATSARFGWIIDVSLWNNNHVVTLDQQESRIREFTIGSTMSTIAGNGFNAYMDFTTPAINQGLFVQGAGVNWGTFEVNQTNGDVFFTTNSSSKWQITKLKRASGLWESVAGSGTTSYTVGDGLTGADVQLGSFPPHVLGFDGTHILAHMANFIDNVTGFSDSFLKTYDATTGTQAHVLGMAGPVLFPANTPVCADGTASTSCLIPASYLPTVIRSVYDSDSSRWLLLNRYTVGSEPRLIRTISSGGNIGTLTTLAGNAANFAYHRSSDLSTNDVYYCNTANRKIYRRNVNTSTETALAWPIASLSCAGTAMVYSTARQSLIFIYQQNNLYGIAEYLNP